MPLIALAAESGSDEILKALLDSGLDATVSFKLHGNNVNALACASSSTVRNLLKQAGCIEVISTDEAVELLKRYEIINPYAEATVKEKFLIRGCYVDDSYRKTSERFLYHYQLYKDGREKLSDYGYVSCIYWLWNKSKSKHLPMECLMSFIAAGSNLDYGLRPAARSGHVEIVKALIAAGAKVSDDEDDVPLFEAAEKGHTEIVKLLLAAPGIDENKRHTCEETPLHMAAEKGHPEIVELLKAAGARE